MINGKEGVPMVIRKITAVVLALAVALVLTATPAVVLADPGTSVSIDDALGVAVGGSDTVDIEISTDDPQGIGSATITLTVDTSVATVTNVASGAMGTVYSNTVGGLTTMTWATGSSPGPIGSDMLFATVTLQAVGSAGECSALDIAVTSMYDATAGNPQPIVPSPVDDGQFCIAGAAPTPTPTPTTMPTPTPTPTTTPTPGTTVAIECCSDVPVAGSCDVDITIVTDDPQGIGSATITLTVDTAVVSVGNVAAGDLGTVFSNTVGGTTTMSAATGASPGPTGTVTFTTVTLNAVGIGCSDLDIEVTSLNDGTAGDPQPIIPDTVTDCTFCCTGECSWTFPHGLTTDPSAVFSRLYACQTVSLPTGTEPANLISVWYYDEAVPEWKWYKPGWPESTLTSLVNGEIYQVIVQDACSWTIPQP
jgi:hypothetical protein